LFGYAVTELTVAKCMHRRTSPWPSPTWRAFLHAHLRETVAVDFFLVPTLTFRLLFVFVVLRHDRRELVPVKNLLGLICAILRRVAGARQARLRSGSPRRASAVPRSRRVIPHALRRVVMRMSERGPGDRPRSGRPLVEVMEPTDLRDGHHAPGFGWMHLAWLGAVVVERLVWPRGVVVADVPA
jgi:hypothetical protein